MSCLRRRTSFLSCALAALALALPLAITRAQERPAASTPPRAAFASGKGPVVAIDEAHKNTHTFASPPFRGLVQLLEADGYRVRPLAEKVSTASLAGVDVLLIAQPGGWIGPDESLTQQEVDALLLWVRNGGSLLLVLDHLPAPSNAARLTTAFGITWDNGYTMVVPSDTAPIGPIIFWRSDSLPASSPRIGQTGPGGGRGYQGADAVLANHSVTRGVGSNQQVRRVVTFVGSAFQPPRGADVLLTLPRDAASFTPAVIPNQLPIIDSATPRSSVGGWAQGAVLKMGSGRAAFFGETGLFSAGPAGDNRIFLLNVFEWLSGAQPGQAPPRN
jgi:hypothetical protein